MTYGKSKKAIWWAVVGGQVLLGDNGAKINITN